MSGWPQYAMDFKSEKQALVQYRCRGCDQQRYGLPNKQGWVKNEPGVSVKCLKCGHVQGDSYNWVRLK